MKSAIIVTNSKVDVANLVLWIKKKTMSLNSPSRLSLTGRRRMNAHKKGTQWQPSTRQTPVQLFPLTFANDLTPEQSRRGIII